MNVRVTMESIKALLPRVQKPARYLGQELNSIVKEWTDVPVRLALAYPDVYEIGMCNLGLAILYDRVNRHPDRLAERVYAPWDDMEAAMRVADMPLYSLETRHSLDEFDVVGFSLQHELNYTNVLNMLELGRVPVWARERTAGHPLIIAGGSCAYNPEPLADLIDAFAIGEGEDVLLELLDVVATWKSEGGPEKLDGRRDLLLHLAAVPGIYVPSLYGVDRPEDGAPTTGAYPLVEGVPARVRKRIVADLGPAPTHPIVPNLETIHDRGMVEIQRGCSRGCRFCQAGIIYRPIRERPVDEVLDAIDELVASTGYSEVGLVSLSSSDHSGIAQIIEGAMARHAEDGLSISLPSLRIDSFSVQLAQMIQSNRKTGFTFAPEAGSQQMRDIINKGVGEEDLMRTAAAAFESGWNRIKLYFMIGLPGETDDDIIEIARLIREIARIGRHIRRRPVDIGVSISTFVPKPHTPFQWEPLAAREDIRRRQALLRDEARIRGVRLSWSDWDTTWLEALLSRGDRRLGTVIHRAWRMGARFDAWNEHLNIDLWQQALFGEGIDPDEYLTRRREMGEPLPWDHIDAGVNRRFLQREYERAMEGALSPDCREHCHACGIMAAYDDEYEPDERETWRCP
jgi:radical SAM family uncharacterized protein